MEWGRDIANVSVETMARDAMQNMVQGTTHGELRNKVINFIQKKKKTTHRALNRSLSQHIKSRKDLESIIQVLEDGGLITSEKKTPRTGGPPSIIYKWSEAE
jgi:flagellar basal body P-ring protein FlgI